MLALNKHSCSSAQYSAHEDLSSHGLHHKKAAMAEILLLGKSSQLLSLSVPQGEDQKKLDIVSNEVFCNALRNSGKTGVIASEEEDLPVAVEETYSGTAPVDQSRYRKCSVVASINKGSRPTAWPKE